MSKILKIRNKTQTIVGHRQLMRRANESTLSEISSVQNSYFNNFSSIASNPLLSQSIHDDSVNMIKPDFTSISTCNLYPYLVHHKIFMIFPIR